MNWERIPRPGFTDYYPSESPSFDYTNPRSLLNLIAIEILIDEFHVPIQFLKTGSSTTTVRVYGPFDYKVMVAINDCSEILFSQISEMEGVTIPHAKEIFHNKLMEMPYEDYEDLVKDW